ncbi:Histidine kinase-, DNA gyrase B-, and HSP90-like ATPase [Marivirga sericea]|uniref:histidine kinase n=1 Tax=Marivirga sericea TaxID=1028 RepID=A0A1X7L5G5_9BACT|nr:HAMP domain-containing sensor histidine kinase [Marivirga sericea]SMG49098.1 Histidine kinase-, DNA gyrase B-, and HSP90-like ATPase [Marivirga sericea]
MKKYSIFIVVFVLITLITSLRSYYHSKEVDQENFIAKTQTRLHQELRKVENAKKEWKNYFERNNSLDFESLNAINSAYPFFIFKNTSLVYWSDEHFAPESKKYRKEGWYFVNKSAGQYLEYSIKSKNGQINLVSVVPLFEYYDVNNEYIQSSYNTDILPPSNIRLHHSKVDGSFALRDLEGEPIFFISLFENFENYNKALHYCILLLEFMLVGMLILLLWNFSKQRKFLSVKLVVFITGICAIWGMMEIFDFPFHFKVLSLFDPKFFASSDFNPSLGYLIINCVLFFLMGHFSIKQISKYLKELSKGKTNIMLLVNLLSYLATISVFYFIYLIYIHSNWGLDSTLSIEFSIFQILSFGIVLLFGFLTFQVFTLTHFYNASQHLDPIRFVLIQLCCFGLFLFFTFFFGYAIVWIGGTVLILNAVIYFAKLGKALESINFLSFIYLFLLITAVAVVNSIAVQSLEKKSEAMQRNILADRIINGNDVLAEYMLVQLDESLRQDEYIKRQFLMPLTPYKTIVDKIEKYYLNDYFDKYDKSVKIFDAGGNTIYPSGTLPMSSSYPIQQMNERNRRGEIKLYLVGNTEGNQLQRKYIYVFEIKHYDFVFAKIVLEFKPKKIRPDNVFPELLVRNRNVPIFSETPYDYALYKNDTLSYSVGDINFPDFVQKEITNDRQLLKIQSEGDFQFNVVVDNDEKLLFSKVSNFWYRFFSNISFFFILCFILVFTISAIQFLKIYWKTRTIGLSAKIQLYFSLAFLIPLLSVSISTIGFVNATFLDDIVSKYEENTNRVAGQLVPLLMEYENGIVDKANLSNEISTITKIINADINLYDLNGQLFLTSQPQVFEKNLLSYKINPQAYASIYQNGQKMITLEEQVGNLNYQSAYVGIRSFNSGELLAILGSPFFKSNKEYDLLLTDLLNNVFNIFVGSFIIFIFLAYAATKILTSPLNLLKQKLSQVNLSAENKPISWQVDDEIGLLIKEYNQMLLKLEKSRLALSKTEKESAWREMAQQVAHEIKNPLTPMKLSLQHLQMKIQRSDGPMPDASAKIDSILSQIENLSDIATSFSSFAKMPIPANERICISEIVKKVVDFFKAENVNINLNLPEEDIYALADPKIMERTFNNMVLNALQSGSGDSKVEVTLKIELIDQHVKISIRDNGMGIPEDNYNKVFLPNFTTKSSGSGIGLAIAKRGIEHAGGEIWFESEPNKGTIFYIELKRLK